MSAVSSRPMDGSINVDNARTPVMNGDTLESKSTAPHTESSSTTTATGTGSGSGTNNGQITSRKDEVPPSRFSEDTASILAKYASSPASLELHIHPTHYRFSGQEGIIPRGNPTMALFLQSVREGELPAVASEVFRDSGITLYEGCAILKIVDFRNYAPNAQQKSEQDFEKTAKPNLDQHNQHNQQNQQTPSIDSVTNGKPGDSQRNEEEGSRQSSVPPAAKPQAPSFRVLLKPTGCSLLNDLMGLSDAGTGRRLTDFFAISMESEILNTTLRQLELGTLDTRVWKKGLKASLGLSKTRKPRTYITHRLTHPRSIRRIVEESPHKGSAYEDFMLGMADLERPSRGSSQFVRMSFIEQLRRKKNINAPRGAGAGAGAAGAGSASASPAVSGAGAGTGAGAGSGLAGMRNSNMVGSAAANTATSATATPSSSAPTVNLPPTRITQPYPNQLARQLLQSQQQLQQQSARIRQQAMMQQLAVNHVPPGPTAQHQIQAQQHQQAILRARAQQQMMRQTSPLLGGGAGVAGPGAAGPGGAGPGGMGVSGGPGGSAQSMRGGPQQRPNVGTPNMSQQQMQQQMPMNAAAAVAAQNIQQQQQQQRLNRPLSRMSRVNGMPMMNNNTNAPSAMGMGMAGAGTANMAQMNQGNRVGNMGSTMLGGNQMGNPSMGNQIGNQMGGQMGNQMGGQMGGQMGDLGMGSQMGNQMGGGQMSRQMPSQMRMANRPMGAAGAQGMGSPHLANQMPLGGGGGGGSGASNGGGGSGGGGSGPMGNQMGGGQMGNPMSPQMGGQMGNPNGLGMGMSPSGSPMQPQNTLSHPMGSGSMPNIPMPQQVPMQVPSQLQQMQSRRPSQLPQNAQVRQMLMNRARQQQVQQQAQQQAHQQSSMPPFSPDLM